MRKMKDSGIEWIGQIPQDWETNRIKYTYEIIGGNGFKEHLQGNSAGDYPFYKVSDINGAGRNVSCAANYVSKDVVTEYRFSIVPTGALIMAKIGEALKKNHRKITSVDCVVDNNLQALVPIATIDARYFFYQFLCIDMVWFDNGGTIPSVNNQKLLDFRIVSPSISVQKIITDYLDSKCAEIDALIAAKEKTNALLKERRQSIIYEAVTKGLNPDAPMKDSGIEWIGQIPKNWEVIPLSKVSERMNNGYVGPTRNIFFDSGVRYLQSLHIKEGKIIFEKAPYYVSPEWAAEHALGTVHTGDVLIVQTGDIGQVACVPEEYNECNCHALIIVTPRSRFCCGEFLSYLLQSHYGRNQLLSCRTGALHPHLNSGNIGSIKLPIPSVDEQKSIVAQLNLECEEYDKAIQQNNAIIEKLKEYRQSVIYEAVTGKIEV